jgi:hypothetical protein
MNPERKRMFRFLDLWFKYYKAARNLTVYIFISILSLKVILTLNDVYDKYINFVTFGLVAYLYVAIMSMFAVVLIVTVYNSGLKYLYIVSLKQDNLKTSRSMVIEIRSAAEAINESLSKLQGFNLKREV